MKKLIFFTLLLAGCVYALLQWQPGIYFGEKSVFDNFTLHTSEPLQGDPAKTMAIAKNKIAASEFFTPEAAFDVYVAAGPGDYAFFTPFCKDHYACVNPFNGHIVIVPPDLAKNQVTGAPEGEARDFSAVLAGAAARDLVRRSMRPLAYLVLSDWLLRG